MGSFFQTYRETKTGSFANQQVGSTLGFGVTERYTCPSNRYAFVFITSGAITSSFNSDVKEFRFYNNVRPAESISLKSTSTISYTNQALGMLVLQPGEKLMTRSMTLSDVFQASGAWRIFEFNIATA